jgi:imidazolonepropionase-like amidohydrolase
VKLRPPRHALLCALAACALAACAMPPPEQRARFAVREAPFTPDSGTIGIRCGQLIDGASNLPRGQSFVLIRDGRIKHIEPGSGNGSHAAIGVPVMDLREYTCLPGLIDMHTHLTDRPEDTADLRAYFSRHPDDTLRLGTENAAATLAAGFTTVRNVGTYVFGADTELRDYVARGSAPGPRMLVSGSYLTIPRGGGDLYIPDFAEPDDNSRFHYGVARGPQQFGERAEILLASGSDLLKVIASGAVLAFGGVPGAPEMTREEIAAVVEVAHAGRKKVAAHAHGAESIRMAIDAGVDTIEHASFLDDAGIAAALERGDVAMAMDIYNGDYIETEGRRQGWPEEFLRKNLETTEVQRQAFSKAVKAGVPLVFATDAGVFPHGLNARQFRIMVKRGMTPMQAIKSATSVAALYLGRDDIGELAAGKLGDVIAVRGDPLIDIGALEQVDVVIKGGLIFKLPDDQAR